MLLLHSIRDYKNNRANYPTANRVPLPRSGAYPTPYLYHNSGMTARVTFQRSLIVRATPRASQYHVTETRARAEEYATRVER
ncbi:hypothetical protein IFM47457_07997 [Aspergillus lentulus]|nr:hypothetical protein IFM47457_07997 [Aspergillus lentulus]